MKERKALSKDEKKVKDVAEADATEKYEKEKIKRKRKKWEKVMMMNNSQPWMDSPSWLPQLDNKENTKVIDGKEDGNEIFRNN